MQKQQMVDKQFQSLLRGWMEPLFYLLTVLQKEIKVTKTPTLSKLKNLSLLGPKPQVEAVVLVFSGSLLKLKFPLDHGSSPPLRPKLFRQCWAKNKHLVQISNASQVHSLHEEELLRRALVVGWPDYFLNDHKLWLINMKYVCWNTIFADFRASS